MGWEGSTPLVDCDNRLEVLNNPKGEVARNVWLLYEATPPEMWKSLRNCY